MILSSVVHFALLLLPGVVDAAPKGSKFRQEKRSTILSRKEWRSLTSCEKTEYIDAVKCLQTRPARHQNMYPGARSRYDDFIGLHIALNHQIHFIGTFFAWHRYYVYLFEKDLRETCDYKGAQPYWDWSLDAVTIDSWAQSPIFDVEFGFGGNGEYIEDISNLTQTSAYPVTGRTGGGIVTTGPWANTTISMGLGKSLEYAPHYLRRDFSPSLAMRTLNSSAVQWVQESDSFALFDRRSQSLKPGLGGVSTHGGGHLAVGGQVGELSNAYSSCGDPLFWVHHGHLDNLWNKWQRLNWTVRKDEITGPDVEWAYPWNYFGDIPYNNITLDTPLEFGPFAQNITVRTVMDISSYSLGYEYI
ncbi:hypothetical protein B2J93_7208 [Marssonina coronariae]|uniref:Tyrosinase copper-binding domain-containing protein n=1 Tax=Diplocarpon coronariae TaxID=2795749 RepID=A0A218Z5Z3_9HELO|nr:hypothetical protein B2J93_7208 [Marssonina coronariae]